MTDSSTGGFLVPISSLPAQGQALNRFLQQWIVGVSTLPPTLVRPAYQPEPPDIPNAGTVWAAFHYTTRLSDMFPYIRHVDNPSPGYDEIQRQEQIEMLITFYDLGTNGLADQYAMLAREGTAIAQNREYLTTQDFKLAYTGDLTAVPVLLKSRWQYRVDLPVTLRRQITIQYGVLDVASEVGTLYTDVLPPSPPRNIGVSQ